MEEVATVEQKSESVTDEEELKAMMRRQRLKEGYRIAQSIHKALIERGIPEMTMEEIDAEIAECRRERRERTLS